MTYATSPIKTFQSHLAITSPKIQLTSMTGDPTTTQTRTSPDQILLHGTLANDAVFSYHLRGGPAFSNSPSTGLVWRLYGSAGEIQVTGPNSFLNAADGGAGYKIEVFEHGGEQKTEEVSVESDVWSEGGEKEVPLFARNVARLYEAFAEGKGREEGVLGFEDAVERHVFLGQVYEKAGWRK